jgi:hypothetical protein
MTDGSGRITPPWSNYFQSLQNPPRIQIGSGNNYTSIDSNGTITLTGEATTWTDFSVPLTRDKQGQSDKPDYDYTNLGLLFPQNDPDEKIYLVMQMDHAKKMDSPIYLHVHYIQSEATQPTYKADCKFYNNGEAVSATWTTISTATSSKGIFTYTSGDILQIATFPAISAPTNETVSANLDLIFYRDDNDLTGDSLAKYLDFHYEIDSLGSDDELSK